MTQPTTAPRRIYTETFGCQMNKLDAQITLEELFRHNYALVDDRAEADVVLFFTCAVRQHAEDRFFSRLGAYGRRKENRPDLKIVVCGCVAEEHGSAILERFPFVDVVCGTRNFHRLPELIDEASSARQLAVVGERAVVYSRSRNLDTRPAQAFVAVMRGCDLNCTYCIVPQVRGRAVSREPEEIYREVSDLVDQGVREVTLLGQTINAYGENLGPEHSLASLLRRLDRLAGLARIRIVTSHPRYMTPDLIEAIAELPSVCEGIHLPVQSGSNAVLKRMLRRYTREDYRRIVEACYRTIPRFALAGDFIVGFPGETEEDFEQSLDLMRAARYQNLFVFKYSPRPGTPAAKLTDDVPRTVKESRNAQLLELQRDISLEVYREAIGTTVEVLVEGPSRRNTERQTGRTRTGQIVIFPPTADPGELRSVRIHTATSLALYGEVVAEEEA